MKKILTLVICIGLLVVFGPATAQVTKWTPRGIGGGGALFSPSFSPHQASEIYLACDMSQFFHTTDLGASWRVLDFRQMQASGGAVVRFTNNPKILYGLSYAHDAATPMKSTDRGVTWNPLPGDPTGGEVYSLYVDDNNADRVLLSDYQNLYLSNNGGDSFAQKFSNSNGCYVAGAFFDGTNIFVGTNVGLLMSTNGGDSFALANLGGIPTNQAMVSFAGAKAGGTTRFFCVTLGSGDVYPGVTGAEHANYQSVYRLDWGQANWTAKVNGIDAAHHPYFVAMAGNNINVAYLAGGSDAAVPIIYKTTDGGASWKNIFITDNNRNIITGWSGHGGDRGWWYGEYALGFAVAPNDPNKAVITDLGFAHLTTDGGATWKQIYLSANDQNPINAPTPVGKNYHSIGLENTSCWWLTWSDANNLFAAFSDIRGIRSTDGGNSWSFKYNGHDLNSMYQIVKHPVTGILYAATSSVHDLYQSTYLTDARIDGGSGRVLFSTNKGETWQTLHDFKHPVVSLALDPNNPNRLYAGVVHSTQGGIFVSNNIQSGSGSTWTKLANPPRTEGHPYSIFVLNDGALVCSYSARRAGNPLSFTKSSGVFVSTNGGTSWIDRSDSGMWYWTKDLLIDPHDATQNTWYACVFSGWGGPANGLGGLYRTTNRGESWTRISALTRVEACTINPANPDEMYITTEEEGLWYSRNRRAANPTFMQDPNYFFRHPTRVFYNPYRSNEIWVTSFGNGLYVGSTSTTAVQTMTESPKEFHLTQNYPNPFNPTTQIRYTLSRPSFVTLKIYDVLGNEMAMLVNELQTAGTYEVSWEARGFASGVYFCRLEARRRDGSQTDIFVGMGKMLLTK